MCVVNVWSGKIPLCHKNVLLFVVINNEWTTEIYRSVVIKRIRSTWHWEMEIIIMTMTQGRGFACGAKPYAKWWPWTNKTLTLRENHGPYSYSWNDLPMWRGVTFSLDPPGESPSKSWYNGTSCRCLLQLAHRAPSFSCVHECLDRVHHTPQSMIDTSLRNDNSISTCAYSSITTR